CRPPRPHGAARRRALEILELVAPIAGLQPGRAQEHRGRRPRVLLRAVICGGPRTGPHAAPASLPAPVDAVSYLRALAAAWRTRCRHTWLDGWSSRPTVLWKYCAPRPRNFGIRSSGQLQPAMRPADVIALTPRSII